MIYQLHLLPALPGIFIIVTNESQMHIFSLANFLFQKKTIIRNFRVCKAAQLRPIHSPHQIDNHILRNYRNTLAPCVSREYLLQDFIYFIFHLLLVDFYLTGSYCVRPGVRRYRELQQFFGFYFSLARVLPANKDTTFILTENPMLKLHKLFKLPLLKINITNLIQNVLFEYHL